MARALTEYNDVMCWCDIAHVHTLTGVEVDAAGMTQAQGIINTITGVYPDEMPSDLRAGDLRKLQDMLAYQAAWMNGRVDLFAEVTASGISQDGVSAQYPDQMAQFLAPLARVSFQRLSWNRAGYQAGPSGRKRYPNADAAKDAVLRGEAEDTSGIGGLVPGRPFS